MEASKPTSDACEDPAGSVEVCLWLCRIFSGDVQVSFSGFRFSPRLQKQVAVKAQHPVRPGEQLACSESVKSLLLSEQSGGKVACWKFLKHLITTLIILIVLKA